LAPAEGSRAALVVTAQLEAGGRGTHKGRAGGKMATMNYKKRVHKRYPDAKLVKNDGDPVTYAVKSGDEVLCESANSPTDAWRQAATFLDRPYGPPRFNQP
jgi:hypothetical protein